MLIRQKWARKHRCRAADYGSNESVSYTFFDSLYVRCCIICFYILFHWYNRSVFYCLFLGSTTVLLLLSFKQHSWSSYLFTLLYLPDADHLLLHHYHTYILFSPVEENELSLASASYFSPTYRCHYLCLVLERAGLFEWDIPFRSFVDWEWDSSSGSLKRLKTLK